MKLNKDQSERLRNLEGDIYWAWPFTRPGMKGGIMKLNKDQLERLRNLEGDI